MTISATLPEVHSEIVEASDLGITTSVSNGREVLDKVHYKGNSLDITDRFLNSMCSLVGISKSIFTLDDPNEVIHRAADRGRLGTIRMTSVNNSVLAISKPDKPIVKVDRLGSILDKVGCEKAEYHNGVIRSYHVPSINAGAEVMGEQFTNKFVIDTPVDGYGLPAAFASIMRLICSNGLVGYAPAFKSEINLGGDGDPMGIMGRFIDSYNNEEAFDAIRRRFESAAKSPASLRELQKVERLLCQQDMRSIHNDVAWRSLTDGTMLLLSDVTRKLNELAGAPLEKYGLVSYNSISEKKTSMLPVDCTVMDLINVATEVGTHRATEAQNRKIQGHLGQMLTKEYDLEGTLDDAEVSDFRPDFYLGMNQQN